MPGVTRTDDPLPTHHLDRWRRDTPGVASRIHLNNAGASLMPGPVINALHEQIDLEARVGGYEAAALVADALRDTYAAVAELLAAAPRNVAIVENATVAFAQALSAFDFRPGDVIVTTRTDYTSNQLMYLVLERRHGVVTLRADDLPSGGLDLGSMRRLIAHPRCRLVALTWVPTNSGLVQPAEAVGALCREAGVPYLVDGCQAVGQLPVDVGRLACDYFAATGRKFLRGPRGIGFLYVSDRILAGDAHPLALDMRGADLVDAGHFVLAPDARRFENWESSAALVLGLGAAVLYALDVGIDVAGGRAQTLADDVRRGLAAMPSATLIEPGTRHCAIVTAAFDGWEAADLVVRLRERGINTTSSMSGPGPFTAPGAEGTSMLRISPHYYNTDEEIARALAAIQEVVAAR